MGTAEVAVVFYSWTAVNRTILNDEIRSYSNIVLVEDTLARKFPNYTRTAPVQHISGC